MHPAPIASNLYMPRALMWSVDQSEAASFSSTSLWLSVNRSCWRLSVDIPLTHSPSLLYNQHQYATLPKSTLNSTTIFRLEIHYQLTGLGFLLHGYTNIEAFRNRKDSYSPLCFKSLHSRCNCMHAGSPKLLQQKQHTISELSTLEYISIPQRNLGKHSRLFLVIQYISLKYAPI